MPGEGMASTTIYEALTEHELLAKLEKSREHAAQNVLNDYDATIESLKHVAGSLKLCDNPRLRQLA